MAEVIRYVDTDVVGGAGDGTSWANAYSTLSAWEAAEQTNLVSDGDWHHVYVRASSGTADTTNVDIDGWTTGSTNYILIEAADGDQALKSGIDTSRYRLQVNAADCIHILEDYVRLQGLQFVATGDAEHDYCVLATGQTSSANLIMVDDCYAEQQGLNRSTGYGFSTNAIVEMNNCIALGPVVADEGLYGFRFNCASATINNCIAYGWDYPTGSTSSGGFHWAAGTITVTNCAVFGNDNDFNGTFTIDYCASDDGDGTNAVSPSGANWDNEFVDAANGDFTLLFDGNLYHGGTDVSLASDIEGDSYHATTPSIGADEVPAFTGDYASASCTNPSSALTDFTFIVDLSDLPAGWWTAAGTNGATTGRVTKSNGEPLATDWIDFDGTADTGLLRVKWSGTLAASGTQTIWIYPPDGVRAALAADHQYGSDNAYDDDWVVYWTMNEDPSGGAPQMIDRTKNDNDGTSEGTMLTADLITGQVAGGLDFDGSDDLISDAPTNPAADYPVTLMAWVKPDGSGINTGIAVGNNSASDEMLILRVNSNLANAATFTGSFNGWSGSATVETAAWSHVAAVWASTTARRVYTDGGDETADATDSDAFPSAMDFVAAGGYNDSSPSFIDGQLDEVQYHKAERSAGWIASEYAQTNDNTTFWGSWTWSGGGAANAPTGHLYGSLVGPFGGPM